MDKEGKTVKIALKCTCISAVRGRESKKETDAKERERGRGSALAKTMRLFDDSPEKLLIRQ